MRRALYLALFIPAGYMASCGSISEGAMQTQQAEQVVNMLGPKDYRAKLTMIQDAQLVDVRTADEYKEGHLPNATNIDYRGSDLSDNAAKLDKTKPVFVYCHSGRRSAAAAKMLKEMGFTKLYDLDGGIMAWKGEGLSMAN